MKKETKASLLAVLIALEGVAVIDITCKIITINKVNDYKKCLVSLTEMEYFNDFVTLGINNNYFLVSFTKGEESYFKVVNKEHELVTLPEIKGYTVVREDTVILETGEKGNKVFYYFNLVSWEYKMVNANSITLFNDYLLVEKQEIIENISSKDGVVYKNKIITSNYVLYDLDLDKVMDEKFSIYCFDKNTNTLLLSDKLNNYIVNTTNNELLYFYGQVKHMVNNYIVIKEENYQYLIYYNSKYNAIDNMNVADKMVDVIALDNENVLILRNDGQYSNVYSTLTNEYIDNLMNKRIIHTYENNSILVSSMENSILELYSIDGKTLLLSVKGVNFSSIYTSNLSCYCIIVSNGSDGVVFDMYGNVLVKGNYTIEQMSEIVKNMTSYERDIIIKENKSLVLKV